MRFDDSESRKQSYKMFSGGNVNSQKRPARHREDPTVSILTTPRLIVAIALCRLIVAIALCKKHTEHLARLVQGEPQLFAPSACLVVKRRIQYNMPVTKRWKENLSIVSNVWQRRHFYLWEIPVLDSTTQFYQNIDALSMETSKVSLYRQMVLYRLLAGRKPEYVVVYWVA
ncbi:hypothetical protein BCV70DRAFT_3897 [Testicularia cyperi]|uniref:Uncharacterized protein n=1 Tax=Testicularia cyperi TaxID=1882483 RepID=A0A317XX17_9BASI|nr:hypothetical protein BCV70DRAFT_3897 [Testicularia cyperi]